MSAVIFWVIVCTGPWALFIGVTSIFDKYGCNLERLSGGHSVKRAKLNKREPLDDGEANLYTEAKRPALRLTTAGRIGAARNKLRSRVNRWEHGIRHVRTGGTND